MVALTVMAAAVVLQSQTLQFGRFSWTCVGLIPFTGKALHVVKYEDETLCAELLDEVEAPWVRANADRTLTVSYGRVGQETSVHYSIDKKNYVQARPHTSTVSMSTSAHWRREPTPPPMGARSAPSAVAWAPGTGEEAGSWKFDFGYLSSEVCATHICGRKPAEFFTFNFQPSTFNFLCSCQKPRPGV